jgi:hypothetical protein
MSWRAAIPTIEYYLNYYAHWRYGTVTVIILSLVRQLMLQMAGRPLDIDCQTDMPD